MGTDTADAAGTAERLRAALVDQLCDEWIRGRRVEIAMRAVPRHVFVPEVSVEEAYADDAVVTKRDADGGSISSASQPAIVAMMLEQLEVEPGQRVLEIGAGTGYNAALLAHLVGAAGEVTTIDLDPDLVDRARRALAAAGYGQVRVICGDGEFGDLERAPYDRVIVTVGAWDLPPAWWDQLASGGRLVVPLRLRGAQQSVAFEHADGCLRSRSTSACSFMSMRGPGAFSGHNVVLRQDGDIRLRLDDEQRVDDAALGAALDEPSTEVWTGVTVTTADLFDQVDLWMACTMAGFCRLTVDPDSVQPGLVTPAFRWGSAAVLDRDSFAYLTRRETSGQQNSATTDDPENEEPRYELGVCAHGPSGAELVAHVADQIRTWNRAHRSKAELRIDAYPAGTPDDHLSGHFVIDKKHTWLAITWPETPS